jgi:hypothetical protein
MSKLKQETVTRDGALWRRVFDAITGEIVAEVNLDAAWGEQTHALIETAPALVEALEAIVAEQATAPERAQAALSLLRGRIG